jgi:DNA-binding GntR family transcriptional regulator
MSTLTSLKTQERLLDRQAANSIREQIVNRIMPPGHRLLEAVLASELEVSRGTIRSALMQLSNEGLVRQVAFTKWEVAPASVSEAWELYTLRGALEGLAASLAAEYASPAERKVLSQVFAELEAAAKADQREAAGDADFKLHKTIVAMSGHKRLIRDHERIILQVRFQMTHIGFVPRDPKDLIEDHRALTEAVVSGDVERAEQLARTHNSAEIKRLLAANARQPSSETLRRQNKKGE